MKKGDRKQFCPQGHDTFVVGRGQGGGCKECNREGVRWCTWRRYGIQITLDEYAQLLSAQAGRCRICGGTGGIRRLDVDHEHATGRIRGLLCNVCNKYLGYVQDNPAILRAAIEYLEN